jgi:hypothetical protein
MYLVRKRDPYESLSINEEVLKSLYEQGPLLYEDIAKQAKQSYAVHGRTVTRDQIRQVLQYLRKLKIAQVDGSHRWRLILPSPLVDLSDLTAAP